MSRTLEHYEDPWLIVNFDESCTEGDLSYWLYLIEDDERQVSIHCINKELGLKLFRQVVESHEPPIACAVCGDIIHGGGDPICEHHKRRAEKYLDTIRSKGRK